MVPLCADSFVCTAIGIPCCLYPCALRQMVRHEALEQIYEQRTAPGRHFINARQATYDDADLSCETVRLRIFPNGPFAPNDDRQQPIFEAGIKASADIRLWHTLAEVRGAECSLGLSVVRRWRC